MIIEKKTLNHCSTLGIFAKNKILTVPHCVKPTKEKCKAHSWKTSYAKIATLKSANKSTQNTYNEVTSSNQRRKNALSILPKAELEKRRVMFNQEPLFLLKFRSRLDLYLEPVITKHTNMSLYTIE